MIKYDESFPQRYGMSLDHDLVVRKTRNSSDQRYTKLIEMICKHFMDHPDPMVVPIYSFDILEGPQNSNYCYSSTKYSYTMKRLGMLNYGEKKLIKLFVDIKKYGSEDRLVDNQLVAWNNLKQQFPQLFQFMSAIYDTGRYNDIHDGNFMKDEEENYRCIDLEGFFTGYPDYDSPKLEWITGIKDYVEQCKLLKYRP